MSNVDVGLDITDEETLEMVKAYIAKTTGEASYELFVENVNGLGIEAAAGKAMINEALIYMIELGLAMDSTDKDTDSGC